MRREKGKQSVRDFIYWWTRKDWVNLALFYTRCLLLLHSPASLMNCLTQWSMVTMEPASVSVPTKRAHRPNTFTFIWPIWCSPSPKPIAAIASVTSTRPVWCVGLDIGFVNKKQVLNTQLNAHYDETTLKVLRHKNVWYTWCINETGRQGKFKKQMQETNYCVGVTFWVCAMCYPEGSGVSMNSISNDSIVHWLR